MNWNKLLNFLLGKARHSPCEECGNPYHFTGEHEWYHWYILPLNKVYITKYLIIYRNKDIKDAISCKTLTSSPSFLVSFRSSLRLWYGKKRTIKKNDSNPGRFSKSYRGLRASPGEKEVIIILIIQYL